MTVTTHRVVIAGAGLAGARTALHLRESGYEGEIIVVGDEPYLPYERPLLSKAALRGHRTLDDLLVAPANDFVDNTVELMTNVSVVKIDIDGSFVSLSDGKRLPYSVLVLATGASARRLECPGGNLPGVHTLRTFDDACRIMDQTGPGARCAVLGLGLVGSEVAATLRTRGLEVTAVEPLPGPMIKILGEQVSNRIATLHRDAGVDLRLQRTVTSVLGDTHTRGLRLDDGTTVAADVVVAGLGAIPNTSIAAAAGIPCNRGVLADGEGRTAVPNIYAVGDVAEQHVRFLSRPAILEHFQAANKQAKRVAAVIAGQEPDEESVAWFWSDHYDQQIQVMGYPGPSDEILLRGDLETLDFVAFHLRGGAVVAASAIGRGRELRRTAGLIRAGSVCDRAALVDDGVDVRSLVSR